MLPAAVPAGAARLAVQRGLHCRDRHLRRLFQGAQRPQRNAVAAVALGFQEAEATVETMMQTIHAHPTLYEAVGEAFNAVYGLAINV